MTATDTAPIWIELEHKLKDVERVITTQFSGFDIRMQEVEHRGKETIALIEASLKPAPPERAEIYTALAKAQKEIVNADANIENEFLQKKYADLASCLNAVRGPLSSNGIALFQLTADPGQGVLGIKTVLAHESGQTITDLITMAPPKIDPQGVGSCRTYMRRYAVIALCGIAGAADDDAESTKQDPDDYDRLASTEVDKILHSADEMFGDRADAVIAKMLDRIFGLKRLGDVKAGEFDVVMNHLKGADKLMKQAAKKGGKDKPKSPKPPEQKEGREPGSDDDEQAGPDVGDGENMS